MCTGKMWHRLARWLLVPIPFPGRTYDIELPEKKYNQEKSLSHELPGGNDERRPPKPR